MLDRSKEYSDEELAELALQVHQAGCCNPHVFSETDLEEVSGMLDVLHMYAENREVTGETPDEISQKQKRYQSRIFDLIGEYGLTESDLEKEASPEI